jgi:hypothetical protein
MIDPLGQRQWVEVCAAQPQAERDHDDERASPEHGRRNAQTA